MKYDSEGNYHNPELRIEHTRLERTDISNDEYNHLLNVYAEIADNLRAQQLGQMTLFLLD
jgi:hypothetical protein